MIQGYKTYILAVLSGVVTVVHALGYIDNSVRDTLLALLASGAVATLASKINRLSE